MNPAALPPSADLPTVLDTPRCPYALSMEVWDVIQYACLWPGIAPKEVAHHLGIAEGACRQRVFTARRNGWLAEADGKHVGLSPTKLALRAYGPVPAMAA